MNRFLLLPFFLLIILTSSAQKKLVPVSTSVLTGIVLPEGTKRDTRLLSEMSGQSLLETESKKANTTISKTEILYLPLSARTASTDSVKAQLKSLGWNSTPLQDEKYLWLQKNNRYVLA